MFTISRASFVLKLAHLVGSIIHPTDGHGKIQPRSMFIKKCALLHSEYFVEIEQIRMHVQNIQGKRHINNERRSKTSSQLAHSLVAMKLSKRRQLRLKKQTLRIYTALRDIQIFQISKILRFTSLFYIHLVVSVA